jgi:F0F1-type ATP synthase delta subunit
LIDMEELDFSDFFKTNVQAVDFITRLSAVSEEIYETDFDLEKALAVEFGIQKKDKFIALLRENRIPPDSGSALKDFINKIQDKVSSLPVVSLTIAFEPEEKTLKSIFDWFPLSINKQVLLDIKVDANIIAGASVSYNGKCLDFTVKPVFDQTYNETPDNN